MSGFLQEKNKNVRFTNEELEALEVVFLKNYHEGGRKKEECLLNSAEELGGEILEKIRKKTSEANRKLCENILNKHKSSGNFQKIKTEAKNQRLLDDLENAVKIIETASNLASKDLSFVKNLNNLASKIKDVKFIKIDMRSNAGAYRLLHFSLEEILVLAKNTVDDKIKLGALTLLVETASKKINAVDPLEVLQEVEEKSKQLTKDNT